MEKLYLCRHGETEWSLSGQHTSVTDLPLTEKGRAQVSSLKKHLENIPMQAVFSSPRKRALETCCFSTYEIDPHLQEWNYGEYEGKTSSEIREKRPGWDLFRDGAFKGESPEDVKKRADLVLQKVRGLKGNIALFSHGHFLKVLAARFLGLEVEKGNLFALSVASLSILGEEKGKSVIFLWNQTF